MPSYIYGCEEKHRQEEWHGMSEEPVIICVKCGRKMHRVPQAFGVNWNGLPPHLEHTRHPNIQNFIDTADQRRDKYLATKGTKDNG